MNLFTQTFTETLVVEHCCTCGVAFGLSKDTYNKRLDDHKGFYCPNGHSQYYLGKSEEDKLRDQLKEKENEIEFKAKRIHSLHNTLTEKNNSIRALKGAKTRLLNRVKNGVCPCCNRSFADLRRHMATKHPDHKE